MLEKVLYAFAGTCFAIALTCFTMAGVLLIRDGWDGNPTQTKVGCTFGKFNPDVLYVVGPTKDYVRTGGTSTDPKVANAYNYGVLYAACL